MLQTSNTSDVCMSHCSVLQGDGAWWGWGVEGSGRAGDGDTAGDGDATRHGGAVVDRPHAVARSFYSHRIGGPVGRSDAYSRRTSEH